MWIWTQFGSGNLGSCLFEETLRSRQMSMPCSPEISHLGECFLPFFKCKVKGKAVFRTGLSTDVKSRSWPVAMNLSMKNKKHCLPYNKEQLSKLTHLPSIILKLNISTLGCKERMNAFNTYNTVILMTIILNTSRKDSLSKL